MKVNKYNNMNTKTVQVVIAQLPVFSPYLCLMKIEKQGGGIYMIINSVNNKFYIGSTNNFKRRCGDHNKCLSRNKGLHPVLQRAVNKYGLESFQFIILEECIDISSNVLLIREQYWIDTLKPQYNANPNATNVNCVRTSESIKKQKESLQKYFDNLGNNSNGNMHGITIVDENDTVIYKFRSREQCEKELGISRTFIRNRLQGLRCYNKKFANLKFKLNEQ